MKVTEAVSEESAPTSAYTEQETVRRYLSLVKLVSSVGPADRWRIAACLTSHRQTVSTGPSSRPNHEPGEGLEVQPQLADVVRDLADGVLAAPGRGGVGAGVSRVPDVGGVGGDGGPAGGGGDDAADPEARGTGAGGRTASAAALGGGVAGPVGVGGGRADALVVGELDDVEQGELLFIGKDIICRLLLYFLLPTFLSVLREANVNGDI